MLIWEAKKPKEAKPNKPQNHLGKRNGKQIPSLTPRQLHVQVHKPPEINIDSQSWSLVTEYLTRMVGKFEKAEVQMVSV